MQAIQDEWTMTKHGPLETEMAPTPVFLPKEPHGQ